MASFPKVVHGLFAFGSLSAAISSILISVRLGALEYIQQNYIEGLCVDVWEGFFRSPLNLIAIAFLTYLPLHCLSIRAPTSMLCFTTIMAIPSGLFIVASLLELMPVILPLGALLHALALFGLHELRLAQQPPKPLKASVSFSDSPLKKSSARNSLPRPAPLSLSHHQKLKSGPPSPISKRKRRQS